jgi:ribosome-associated protein
MPTQDIRQQVALALEAVNNKKAEDVALLQLPGESSTFTDYFLICSGSNPRQVQAIADEVDERLSKDMGVEPNAREGYNTAEWILLDYVDFVVHIFNAQRRAYYDLERLWKSAHKLTAEELLHPTAASAAAEVEAAPAPPRVKKAAKKAASKKSVSVRAAAKQSVRGGGAKAAPRKAAAKKTSAKKTSAKKTAAKKTSAKKTAVKKTSAKKTAVKKTAKKSAKKAAVKKSAKKAATKKTAAKKSSAKRK